jgi:hypothetical protein
MSTQRGAAEEHTPRSGSLNLAEFAENWLRRATEERDEEPPSYAEIEEDRRWLEAHLRREAALRRRAAREVGKENVPPHGHEVTAVINGREVRVQCTDPTCPILLGEEEPRRFPQPVPQPEPQTVRRSLNPHETPRI